MVVVTNPISKNNAFEAPMSEKRKRTKGKKLT